METIQADVVTTPPEQVEVSATRKLGPIGWLSVTWLTLICGSALLAPILPISDPDKSYGREIARRGPGAAGHILGGDAIGRDMLARVIYGARTSLLIAVGAVLLGLVVGGLLAAGYVRGKTDTVLTTLFNVLLSIPALVLALSLVAVLAPTDPGGSGDVVSHTRRMLVLILALGVVTVPILGRITRAATLSWAEREFVKAAEVSGAKPVRIVFREVLPNVLPAMMSITLLGIAVAIVAEGSLALLGVGITEEPTWGNMIEGGRDLLNRGSPHIVFIPSIAIFLTVMSLNYLGDVIRARFDVREAVLWARSSTPSTPFQPDGHQPNNGVSGVPTPQPHPGQSRRLLEVNDLRTQFKTARGMVKAVDGVSLTLDRGRTLGIVGESGSGKTVLSRSIMGLMPKRNVVREGQVLYNGIDMLDASPAQVRDLWGAEMAMIFQDPMTSLNPVLKIGNQITEGMRFHLGMDRSTAEKNALSLLREVGIPEPERRLKQYPHELSGGMRQRIMIAVALACGPKLLFADEPTTALDVTVQAQILNLLGREQRERDMGMILVTHDLGVVAGRTDEIAVMYAGQIVEKAPTATLFRHVRMPYTEALLKSIPAMDAPSHSRLQAIPGRPPDLVNPPAACRFAPRCPYVQEKCTTVAPPLVEVEPGHAFRCWFPVGLSPESVEQAVARQEAEAAAAAEAEATAAEATAATAAPTAPVAETEAAPPAAGPQSDEGDT